MSAPSGIAATGVVLALAVLALGQPLWEWRFTGTAETDVWSYKMFTVDHVVENATTGSRTVVTYTYYDLPGQPRMSALFIELGRMFTVAVLAAVAGLGLSIPTLRKKLRGVFAGLAFLGGSAAALYAALEFVIRIPGAALDFPTLGGRPIADFRGQFLFTNNETLTWGPLGGWFLLLGVGLVLAWTSSELWHVRVPTERAALPAATPAAPARTVGPTVHLVRVPDQQEPVIDEVFVIAPSGLLVKHMSRTLMSDKDRDVVGGMISVVSNFVRDAFTEKQGEVQEIVLGGHRFIMYNQKGLVLAVLVGKGDTEPILHRLKHLAALLLEQYGGRLTLWNGEALDGIEDELAVLWEPFFVPPPPVD